MTVARTETVTLRLTPKDMQRLDDYRKTAQLGAFTGLSRARAAEVLVVSALPPWKEPQTWKLPEGLCRDDRSWTDGRGFHCEREQGHVGDCEQEQYGEDFKPPSGMPMGRQPGGR